MKITRGSSRNKFNELLYIIWIIIKLSKADNILNLNISEPFLDMKVSSTLFVKCSGGHHLAWKRIDPLTEESETNDSSFTTVNTDEMNEIIIRLELISIEQTGRYTCYNNKASASFYLFVYDDKQLLLGPQFNIVRLEQGEIGIISCLPTVSKANVIFWKKRGTNGEENISLYFDIEYDPTVGFIVKNPTDYFHGWFECQAEFENRKSVNTWHIEFIHETSRIPEVYIDDSDAKYVLVQSSFNLTCTVRVDKATDIDGLEWNVVDDGKRITLSRPETKNTGDDQITNQTLTIRNTTKSDEGPYQCNATDHSKKSNYYEVYVKVYETPQKPKVTFDPGKEDIIKSRGQDVKLIASYKVFPPSSDIDPRWFKDNATIVPDDRKFASRSDSAFVFKIFNLTWMDSGVYSVKVHAPGGISEKSFKLRVKDKPVIKVWNTSSCCYAPNKSYKFLCQSKGYPVPDILWKWKPYCSLSECKTSLISNKWEVINSNSSLNKAVVSTEKDNDRTFSYLLTTAYESGYYKCISNNSMGKVEREILYVVTDAENGFEIASAQLSPIEFDTFSAVCKVSSDLFANLRWKWKSPLDNKTLDFSNNFLVYSNTSNSISLKLEIQSIHKDQEGYYTCMASLRNETRLPIKSIFVHVREILKPYFVNISMNESEIIMLEDSVFEMDCYAGGTPSPNITWYRDGKPFAEKPVGRFMDDNQKFIISRLVKDDEGDYECKAVNIAGSISHQFTLLVIADDFEAAPRRMLESQQIAILAVAAVGAAVGISLHFLVRWLYKRKRRNIKLQDFNHQIFREGQMAFYDPNMPLDDQADLLPYDERWEFPRDKLKLGKTLGQGAFGRVVKAEAIGLNDYETSSTVAVKMLKENADITQQKALMAELKILIHLGHHVNIVNLLGAVTEDIPRGGLLVIVEYCKYGNMRHYLQRYRSNFIDDMNSETGRMRSVSESLHSDVYNAGFRRKRFSESSIRNSGTFSASTSSGAGAVANPNYRSRVQSIVNADPHGFDSSDPSGSTAVSFLSSSSDSGNVFKQYHRIDSQEHTITTSDLLCYSFQCARGMEYLSSKKLIHRDLAARNILLAQDKIVKICDFGLAKDCYKYENYIKKGDGPLPIKWMSIESIGDHIFTTKSDVWSLGILMWEFFTLGGNPYPGMEIDNEFYKKLKAGYRMEKPNICPDCVYGVMMNCWNANPEERPDFGQISKILGDFLADGVRQHYIDLNDPYMEMNSKIQNDYLNMESNAFQDSSKRLYVNSDLKNSSSYDNLPSIHRPVQQIESAEEPIEIVPMIQLH